jgi:non-ribosomal peptide synthetase component F/acyl carrier protein
MDSTPALRQSPGDRWLDRFERQAELTPFRTAVVNGPGSMTYDELSTRSNRLASLLHSRGVGRGNFVGLGFAPSLDLPVGLLGIMKSGAAYVPLDPGYPAARIGRTVDAAGIRHVVTRRDLTAAFPDLETIHLDDLPPFSTAPVPLGDDGLRVLPRWYSIELETGPADRTLIISSASFDLTRKNFFTPLLTGGTLVLDDGANYDVRRISCLVRDLRVTLIHCTPAAFHPLVEAAADDGYAALASLRFAVLEGGPVSMTRLREWLEHPACHAEVVHSESPATTGGLHWLDRGNLDDAAHTTFGLSLQSSGLRSTESAESPARGTKVNRVKNPLESRVLELWSEVLDRPLDDPNATFLDLGGNSIHLAVIHVRLMERTARRFPIDTLLKLPTARATAEFLITGKLPDLVPAASKPVRKAHAGFAKTRRHVTR